MKNILLPSFLLLVTLNAIGTVTGYASTADPVVTITNPNEGDIFTAGQNIIINASATETNGTIKQVTFYYNKTKLCTLTSAPYNCAWNNLPSGGPYYISADALDSDNNTGKSSLIKVFVAPVVVITSPSDGSTFTAGQNLTINTSATETNGSIQQVTVYYNKTLLCTLTAAPYNCNWSNLPVGEPYYISAQAIDINNITGKSPLTQITVDPAIPTNLSASSSSGQIALTWTAGTGASTYSVFRGTTSGGESNTPIASKITSTDYTDSSVTNGQKYYYFVQADSGTLNSGNSNEASATPQAATLSAPTNLTATGGVGQVALTWTASSGAASYSVYRGTSSSGESNTAIATGISTTSYTDNDTKLVAGQKYYYEVKSFNSSASVSSSYSNEASAATLIPAPAAPTNLTATGGVGQVSLTWSASTGAASYSVYRGTSSGGESSTAIATGISTKSYTDNDKTLSVGKTYYYEVKAFNSSSSVSSGYSNEVSAATLIPAPVAPSNLVTQAASGKVTLTWTASSGATSYTVYRGATSGGESATAIASGLTAATYPDSSVSNGQEYFYVVKAFNGTVSSGNSNEANATPSASIPPTPTGLTASAGDSKVSLLWTASTAGATYNILRSTSSDESNPAIISGISTTSFIDTSVTNKNTYYYEVSATLSKKNSPASSPAVSATPLAAVPPAPTNLTATGGTNQINLMWTASSGAKSYSVFRGTSSGEESATAIASGLTATSYPDLSATDNQKYYYEVKAYDGSEYSGASNEASATAHETVLSAPSAPSLNYYYTASRSIELIWTPGVGGGPITWYNVYSATSLDGPYNTKITTTSNTQYQITGLNNNSPNYYEVTAGNNAGTAYSNPIETASKVATSSDTAIQSVLSKVPGYNQLKFSIPGSFQNDPRMVIFVSLASTSSDPVTNTYIPTCPANGKVWGTDPSCAYKTPVAAYNSMCDFNQFSKACANRNNIGDWLLLRRGDTFDLTGLPLDSKNNPSKLNIYSSGSSDPTQPFLIGAFTDPNCKTGPNSTCQGRPILEENIAQSTWSTVTKTSGFVLGATTLSGPNNVAIFGLKIYALDRDPTTKTFLDNYNQVPNYLNIMANDSDDNGIDIRGKINGLYIEDCDISYWNSNISVYDGSIPVNNLRLNRSLITHSWGFSPSEGLYLEDTTNALITDNLFWHNGWISPSYYTDSSSTSSTTSPLETVLCHMDSKSSSYEGTGCPSNLNHNFYLAGSSGPATVRNNIFAGASAGGIEMRPGGTLQGNFFTWNRFHTTIGYVKGAASVPQGINANAQYNVFVHDNTDDPVLSPDISPINIGNTSPYVIDATGVTNVIATNIVANNIFTFPDLSSKAAVTVESNAESTNFTQAVGVHNLTIKNNDMYQMVRHIQIVNLVPQQLPTDGSYPPYYSLSGLNIESNLFQYPSPSTEPYNWFLEIQGSTSVMIPNRDYPKTSKIEFIPYSVNMNIATISPLTGLINWSNNDYDENIYTKGEILPGFGIYYDGSIVTSKCSDLKADCLDFKTWKGNTEAPSPEGFEPTAVSSTVQFTDPGLDEFSYMKSLGYNSTSRDDFITQAMNHWSPDTWYGYDPAIKANGEPYKASDITEYIAKGFIVKSGTTQGQGITKCDGLDFSNGYSPIPCT